MNFDDWKSIREAERTIAEAKEVLDNAETMNEGKMKEIDMISKESKSKSEFETKLKTYLKSIKKDDLANDPKFIESMTKDWKPADQEENED